MLLPEIISIRTKILEKVEIHGSYFDRILFYILSEYGLRISEVKELHTSTKIEGTIYSVRTKKRGENRIINFYKIHEIIDECILKKQTIFFEKSISTYAKDFEKYNNHNHLKVGQKNLELHFFRHAKMKEMYGNGISVHDIKSYFGLRSATVVEGYISSNLKLK